MENSSGRADKGNILNVTKADQYRTVEELFERSKANSAYYTLLVLSVLVITLGILLSNSAVVIGGMLITPMLTPLLVVGLSLAVGEVKAIRGIAWLIGKSVFIILMSAMLLSLFFGHPREVYLLDNTARTAVLYFIVAVLSGVAGAFGWARKEILEVLPGVAISVSIVPPLSLAGIWLSALQFDTARFYLFIFFLNLFGVIVGSLIVFSLLRFYRMKKEVEELAKESDSQKNKR